MNIRGLPIGRLVAESVVVVGSILLALAIDQAMAERQDRALETHYLAALAEDFRSTIAWTTVVGPQINRDREHNAKLIDAVLRSDEGLTFDSVAVAHSLVRIGAVPQMIVYEATMGELLATGNLRVIRNAELRSRLVEFFDLAETFQELYAPMLLRVNEAVSTLANHVPPAVMAPLAEDGWTPGRFETTRGINPAQVLWVPMDTATAPVALRTAVAASDFIDGLRADDAVAGVLSMLVADIYLIRLQLLDLGRQAEEVLELLEDAVARQTT